jgi:hypothetical protein
MTTKTQQTIEHVIVTFFEAGLGYLIVIPTVSWTKTALAGAIGAGLSAVYNVIRQSTPPNLPIAPYATIDTKPLPPIPPLNGVTQLTSPVNIVAPSTPVEPPAPTV